MSNLVHFAPLPTPGQFNKLKRVALCGVRTTTGSAVCGVSNKAHVTCPRCKAAPKYAGFPDSQVTR